MADTFGLSTVATVLRRERAVFEDNARRNRDVMHGGRFEEIIAAFDKEIAHVEGVIASTRPTHLTAVA